MAVRLQRPEDYELRAGQWFRVTLDTSEGPAARTFSHATAPHDDWLEFATRLSDSAFKHAVAALSAGDEISISAAGGRLALPSGDRVVAISGGVGIVPIRSLFRDAVASGRRFDHSVIFSANRNMNCELYLDEMLSWSEHGVHVVRVLEQTDDTSAAECGFITPELIARYLDIADGVGFIVTGPPPMVAAMQQVLDRMGVEEGRRVVENFGPVARR